MNGPCKPRRDVVLIGFMGSGKSTVGRELQHRLGYPLVDMDHLLEQRAGRSIATLFASDGEGAFRDMETALLEELCGPEGPARIVSTGGGVVGREVNRGLLRHLGYVVWLNAPLATMIERISKNRDRPLLQGHDAATRAAGLLEQRLPLYASAAHLTIDTADLDCGEIATGILESARYFFNGSR